MDTGDEEEDGGYDEAEETHVTEAEVDWYPVPDGQTLTDMIANREEEQEEHEEGFKDCI